MTASEQTACDEVYSIGPNETADWYCRTHNRWRGNHDACMYRLAGREPVMPPHRPVTASGPAKMVKRVCQRDGRDWPCAAAILGPPPDTARKQTAPATVEAKP